MNLAERLLDSGFIETSHTRFSFRYNPKDNWLGASVYYPDLEFIRGNKKVIVSINGMSMPQLPKDLELKYRKQIAPGIFEIPPIFRYIGFYIDNNNIYESFLQELPSEDFISEFIQAPVK